MGMQKIRFKKGKKKVVKTVTALELGLMIEKGWEVDEVIEILGTGFR